MSPNALAGLEGSGRVLSVFSESPGDLPLVLLSAKVWGTLGMEDTASLLNPSHHPHFFPFLF